MTPPPRARSAMEPTAQRANEISQRPYVGSMADGTDKAVTVIGSHSAG